VSPSLGIDVDKPPAGSFRPGDWVRGRVNVLEGGKSRALHVEVRFRERTSDYSATPAVYGQTQLHEGELTAGASFPFAIQLPPDCFPSLQTENAMLFYEVHARSDERGLDTHADAYFEVNAGS
jgi:Arrestin (or S-antigen), N-terminal domain